MSLLEEKTGSIRHTQYNLKNHSLLFIVCLPCVYAQITKPYMDL